MQHDYSKILEIDSPYWDRVQEIYKKNEEMPKKVVSGRNLHHKFPKSFSKILGEPIDNDLDNLVSLSLSEHVLVHYYYYLLAKKGYRGPMASAFRYMVRKCMRFITPETMELIARDYEDAKPIADMYMSNVIKEKWQSGVYDHIREKYDIHEVAIKIQKKLKAKPKEEIERINYEKGKSLRGKTYEDAYGVEKALELKSKRSESNRNRDYSNYKKPEPKVLIKCVETGEIMYMGEWCKKFGLKSRSSICNVLGKKDKCCRKLHFERVNNGKD